jgi:hypothetical protein
MARSTIDLEAKHQAELAAKWKKTYLADGERYQVSISFSKEAAAKLEDVNLSRKDMVNAIISAARIKTIEPSKRTGKSPTPTTIYLDFKNMDKVRDIQYASWKKHREWPSVADVINNLLLTHTR